MAPFGDSPFDEVDVGKRVYLDIINKAESEVHIMTPYLVIDSELLEGLKYAAARGVDVEIMMPASRTASCWALPPSATTASSLTPASESSSTRREWCMPKPVWQTGPAPWWVPSTWTTAASSQFGVRLLCARLQRRARCGKGLSTQQGELLYHDDGRRERYSSVSPSAQPRDAPVCPDAVNVQGKRWFSLRFEPELVLFALFFAENVIDNFSNSAILKAIKYRTGELVLQAERKSETSTLIT